MAKVKGISCDLKQFSVVTLGQSDDLWFYGTFDTNQEAVDVVERIGFGKAIVLRKGEIDIDQT